MIQVLDVTKIMRCSLIQQLVLSLWSNKTAALSMVSCQKGPTRHAYAWQIGPFWQDTLVMTNTTSKMRLYSNKLLEWLKSNFVFQTTPTSNVIHSQRSYRERWERLTTIRVGMGKTNQLNAMIPCINTWELMANRFVSNETHWLHICSRKQRTPKLFTAIFWSFFLPTGSGKRDNSWTKGITIERRG